MIKILVIIEQRLSTQEDANVFKGSTIQETVSFVLNVFLLAKIVLFMEISIVYPAINLSYKEF